MHRVLKPTGTLWLQCDTHANSYMRLLLDAVFGRNLFVNELVRRRAPAKGDAKTRLANNHDTILIYEKQRGRRKWRPSYEPYDLKRLQRTYTKDELKRLPEADRKTLKDYKHWDGARRYGLDNLTSPQKNRPNLTYEFLGFMRVWRWTRDRMEAAHAKGLVVQERPGTVPRRKKYLDEQPGRLRDDCWMDVPDTDRNEEGWTTRKSLDLYSRIVECATDIGDVVLDPFCGCATTCVAAEKLHRDWVGIDIDPVAEDVTNIRLHSETRMTGKPRVRKTLRRRDIEIIPDTKLRQALWARQGRQCANPYCDSMNLRSVDLALDHRIPKVRGGDNDALNRIGLCGNCNSRKGRKAWGQFLDEERSRQPHFTRGQT